jgi:hypothetical protein
MSSYFSIIFQLFTNNLQIRLKKQVVLRLPSGEKNEKKWLKKRILFYIFCAGKSNR